MYGMVITVYDKPIQVPQEMLDQVDEHIFIIGKAVLGTQLSHFSRKARNKPDFIFTVMCLSTSQMPPIRSDARNDEALRQNEKGPHENAVLTAARLKKRLCVKTKKANKANKIGIFAINALI